MLAIARTLLILCMPLLPGLFAGGAEDEFGPRNLGREATSARRGAEKVRANIVKDARRWIDRNEEARPSSVEACAGIVARWIPGAEELETQTPIDRALLESEERELLAAFAEELAGTAEKLLDAGLGGAAGFEAYRALGMDPGCAPAGALLGYENHGGTFAHPRFSGGRLTSEAVSRNGSTALPHVQSLALFEIHTDVSADLGSDWGPELDQVLLWMRARFLKIPRYREPAWPIEVRVYSDAAAIEANDDRVPAQGFAHWLPREKHVVVLASAFEEGRTMPMEWVVKHELAHAFLDLGFPSGPDPKTGLDNAVSGWLTEGFEAWIYGASSERPNDVRFWQSVPTRGEGVAALLQGDDVFGELVDKGWIPSRSSPLADVAPVLADYCAADEIRWEGFARLTANLHSYKQEFGDFRAQLGSPKKVSKALREWAEDHRQLR